MMLTMTTFDADFRPPPVAAPPVDADHGLVLAARAGDRVAFESLYRRHAGRVHAVILRLLGGDRGRAEDLTQEAFVLVWQKLGDFRGESRFATWLHRLAINLALMALRQDRSRPLAAPDGDAMLAEQSMPIALSPELHVDLESLIPRLPPRARAVWLLHDLEGWQHDEIGQQLGMAVGTSKAQLHRARNLLKHWLGVNS
ncbi:MAG: RNA polymerase sigma factor [Lysobacterales bacterium]